MSIVDGPLANCLNPTDCLVSADVNGNATADTAVFNNIVYKNQGDGGICEEGKTGTNNDYENNLVSDNFCANCSPPQARDW